MEDVSVNTVIILRNFFLKILYKWTILFPYKNCVTILTIFLSIPLNNLPWFVPMASSVTVFSIPIVWSEIIIVIGSAQFTAARDLRLAIECSRCGCCRGCVIRDGMSWIATGKVATVARIVSGSWIIVAATSTVKLLTALLFHLKWKNKFLFRDNLIQQNLQWNHVTLQQPSFKTTVASRV